MDKLEPKISVSLLLKFGIEIFISSEDISEILNNDAKCNAILERNPCTLYKPAV